MQDCLYSVCSTSAPPADCRPLDQSPLEMWAINKRKKVRCNGRDRRVKGRKKGRKQEAFHILLSERGGLFHPCPIRLQV